MTPLDQWGVYMVRCADGSLYTGITTDLPRRVSQHQNGTASKYTRARRPVEAVYWESATNRSTATRRELAIKALSRQQKLALLVARSNDLTQSEMVPVS